MMRCLDSLGTWVLWGAVRYTSRCIFSLVYMMLYRCMLFSVMIYSWSPESHQSPISAHGPRIVNHQILKIINFGLFNFEVLEIPIEPYCFLFLLLFEEFDNDLLV